MARLHFGQYTTTSLPHWTGGVQGMFRFDNEWEVSVICTPYSYGGESGLWEVAEFGPYGLDDDSVRGWLTAEEVSRILSEIEDR